MYVKLVEELWKNRRERKRGVCYNIRPVERDREARQDLVMISFLEGLLLFLVLVLIVY